MLDNFKIIKDIFIKLGLKYTIYLYVNSLLEVLYFFELVDSIHLLMTYTNESSLDVHVPAHVENHHLLIKQENTCRNVCTQTL